jgi:hypothetical protein
MAVPPRADHALLDTFLHENPDAKAAYDYIMDRGDSEIRFWEDKLIDDRRTYRRTLNVLEDAIDLKDRQIDKLKAQIASNERDPKRAKIT